MDALRAPIAIVGPTAVGKSATADGLASALGGEIVSADSMQVYRGMDIGTAKTPPHERRVAHHCIDIAEPGAAYSAALYQADARRAIDDIIARRLVPVVCGGTGLYMRAALDEFAFPGGELGTPARRRYEALAAEIGPEGLHAVLRERDFEAASAIHPHNARRVMRALEMADAGVSYAEQVAGFRTRTEHYAGTRFFGLTMERPALYGRIDRRVDAMLAEGLLDEVRGLMESGYRTALTAAQAIGYKELVPVLEGNATLAEAAEAIKRGTRRYAKRQLTWFRADPRVRWLDVTHLSSSGTVEAVLRLVESLEQTG